MFEISRKISSMVRLRLEGSRKKPLRKAQSPWFPATGSLRCEGMAVAREGSCREFALQASTLLSGSCALGELEEYPDQNANLVGEGGNGPECTCLNPFRILNVYDQL
jgi:hypothetical protein